MPKKFKKNFKERKNLIFPWQILFKPWASMPLHIKNPLTFPSSPVRKLIVLKPCQIKYLWTGTTLGNLESSSQRSRIPWPGCTQRPSEGRAKDFPLKINYEMFWYLEPMKSTTNNVLNLFPTVLATSIYNKCKKIEFKITKTPINLSLHCFLIKYTSNSYFI